MTEQVQIVEAALRQIMKAGAAYSIKQLAEAAVAALGLTTTAPAAGTPDLTQAEVDALLHPAEAIGSNNGVGNEADPAELEAQKAKDDKNTENDTQALHLVESYLFNEDADELDDDEIQLICWSLFRKRAGTSKSIDILTIARCLAAYGLNVAYGATLDTFEVEHITELAKQVGCRVLEKHLNNAGTRKVLDEILKERRLQIGIGYDAKYDDDHPLHGRMGAITRLNDPNHTYKDILEAAAILVADLERQNRLPPAETPAPTYAGERVNGHLLYSQGDKDIPSSLLDQNGDIVLAQCKVCGAAEIELEVACTGEKLVRHE